MSKYSMVFANRCTEAANWQRVQAAQTALWTKAANYKLKSGKRFTIETYARIEDSPNFEAVRKSDGAVWARFGGSVSDQDASAVADAFLEVIFAIQLPEVEGGRTEDGGRKAEGRRQNEESKPRAEAALAPGRVDVVAAAVSESAAPVKAKAEPVKPHPKAVFGPVWSVNEKKHGVEIRFPGKPSETVLESLRNFGFHWSERLGLWWDKDAENVRKAAAIICRMAALAPGVENRNKESREPKTSESAPVRFDPLAQSIAPTTESTHSAIQLPEVAAVATGASAFSHSSGLRTSASASSPPLSATVIHADFKATPAVLKVPVSQSERRLPAWLRARMLRHQTGN